MIRIVLIIKILLNSTFWNSHRATRIWYNKTNLFFAQKLIIYYESHIYGEEADYLFALKCIMKRNPLLFVSITGGLSILFFGHALAICEGLFS